MSDKPLIRAKLGLTNAPRSITEPRAEVSDTPRTDIAELQFETWRKLVIFGRAGDPKKAQPPIDEWELSRQLERELSDVTRKLAEAEERHRRLKMSADTLVAAIGYVGEIRADDEMVHNLLAVLKRIDPQ